MRRLVGLRRCRRCGLQKPSTEFPETYGALCYDCQQATGKGRGLADELPAPLRSRAAIVFFDDDRAAMQAAGWSPCYECKAYFTCAEQVRPDPDAADQVEEIRRAFEFEPPCATLLKEAKK